MRGGGGAISISIAYFSQSFGKFIFSLFCEIGQFLFFLSDFVQVLLLLQENSNYQRMLTSKISIWA